MAAVLRRTRRADARRRTEIVAAKEREVIWKGYLKKFDLKESKVPVDKGWILILDPTTMHYE
jgi:hypothetical protein